ncbi:hypothetical protein [Echinicola sp. 20G]|uniref:hypothetical protein n=1 Tax=Echinicola sp. 20G TaxID=2781961 RepID=UPI0019107F54|nr:hypothetical protein [Echinicola sp. 20G]
MSTKVLMVVSSTFMGVLGVTAVFLPQEILSLLGEPPSVLIELLIQLVGALYFGFAIMNWMAKSTLIGGIYAKPLCMGNFTHFTIAALGLLKGINDPSLPIFIWGLTLVYVIFATWFGLVFFTHPKMKKTA